MSSGEGANTCPGADIGPAPYRYGVRIVGRVRERELLDARLRGALGGVGHVVLVAGEPGVGKTRLAREAAEQARALGMACHWGRATDDEGSPPYWPFRQVVRRAESAGC